MPRQNSLRMGLLVVIAAVACTHAAAPRVPARDADIEWVQTAERSLSLSRVQVFPRVVFTVTNRGDAPIYLPRCYYSGLRWTVDEWSAGTWVYRFGLVCPAVRGPAIRLAPGQSVVDTAALRGPGWLPAPGVYRLVVRMYADSGAAMMDDGASLPLELRASNGFSVTR